MLTFNSGLGLELHDKVDNYYVPYKAYEICDKSNNDCMIFVVYYYLLKKKLPVYSISPK